MTIETKFNIGDQIFFIGNKKSTSSIVQGIKIEIGAETTITYLCNNDSDARVGIKVLEQDAYATREKLVAEI